MCIEFSNTWWTTSGWTDRIEKVDDGTSNFYQILHVWNYWARHECNHWLSFTNYWILFFRSSIRNMTMSWTKVFAGNSCPGMELHFWWKWRACMLFMQKHMKQEVTIWKDKMIFIHLHSIHIFIFWSMWENTKNCWEWEEFVTIGIAWLLEMTIFGNIKPISLSFLMISSKHSPLEHKFMKWKNLKISHGWNTFSHPFNHFWSLQNQIWTFFRWKLVTKIHHVFNNLFSAMAFLFW